MKNLIFLVITFLLFSSCSQHKTSEEQTKPVQSYDDMSAIVSSNKSISEDEDVTTHDIYRIISEKKNVNPKFGTNKCNIEVELKEKISVDKLTAIAIVLRETRDTYDKLWIFYYLPGMQLGSGAWATTHFTPTLEVKILGATENEEQKMKTATVNGDVIGKWNEIMPGVENTIIIYKKGGKIFMKNLFKDGSVSNKEFVQKKHKGKIRFEIKQKPFDDYHDYYLIENNSNLGIYDNLGKITEAIKLD